jgi:hypothetical protein
MPEATIPALGGWESFYVIVGSSGAALIGLQFVVIVLIAEVRSRATPESIGAFGTPTVVHFGAALLISAVMSAPWSSLASTRVPLALGALLGIIIVARAFQRARTQSTYKPVWEDWLWHMLLPFVAYVALFVAALLLPSRAVSSLFVIAAVALTLLFIGIHNAWDTVTFIAMGGIPRESDEHT